MSYLPQISDVSWNTAYLRDFSALSDDDLYSGGDGGKTIDNKAWVLGNVAKATDVAVGSTPAGLKITVDAGEIGRLYQLDARAGCYLYSKLAQYLAGTEAEGRNDIELRISQRFAYTGAFAGTYEGLSYGLSTPTLDANYHHWIHQGIFAGGTNLDRVRSDGPGTLIGGLAVTTELTTPALAYYPNCTRLTIKSGGIRQTEYSDDGAASLAAAAWSTAAWEQATAAQIPILNPGAEASGKELMWWFGVSKYYATGGITSIILKELMVEWRLAPRGDVVFLA